MSVPPPVQVVDDGALTGVGKTFGESDGWETPASGNLIVVYSACSGGLRDLTIPTGYSLLAKTNHGLPACPAIACFFKISDGTESEVLVEWSGATAQWVAIVHEYDSDAMVYGGTR